MDTGRKALALRFTSKANFILYSKPICRLAKFIQSINNLFELMSDPIIICEEISQSIKQSMSICKVVMFYDLGPTMVASGKKNISISPLIGLHTK